VLANLGIRPGQSTRIVATRDLLDWEIAGNQPDQLLLRPSSRTANSIIGYAMLAAGLSAFFYYMGARAGGYLILHATLWAIAIVWPMSMLWQRASFTREGDWVVLRGVNTLRQYRTEFPVGGTGISITVHRRHRTSSHGHSHVVTGHNWHVILQGGGNFENLMVGYTPGSKLPGYVPSNVRRLVEKLQTLLDAPVHDNTQGGTLF